MPSKQSTINDKSFNFVPNFVVKDHWFTQDNKAFTHYRFANRGKLRIISHEVLSA